MVERLSGYLVKGSVSLSDLEINIASEIRPTGEKETETQGEPSPMLIIIVHVPYLLVGVAVDCW